MTTGADGAPRFVRGHGPPIMARSHTGDPDDHWDDRFTLAGMNHGVLVLAAVGTDLYAGGLFTTAGGKSSSFIGLYYTGDCGNGTLDAGERCDPLIAGTGACYNPNTCQHVSAGEVCRAAVGPCDAADICDGASTICPADLLEPATTECRPLAGDCDIAPEFCTGSSGVCPADAFSGSGTPCTADLNLCTDDVCDGAGACVHPNNTESCDDGDLCTDAHACAAGICVSGGPTDCDDGSLCTIDSCDSALSSDGVQKVQLKTGDLGKTKAQLKGRGPNLEMPVPISGIEYFDQDPSVVAQLISSEGKCWTSEFLSSNTAANDGVQFKAKAP